MDGSALDVVATPHLQRLRARGTLELLPSGMWSYRVAFQPIPTVHEPKTCEDPWCISCATAVCPDRDLYHFHPSGCPSCRAEP